MQLEDVLSSAQREGFLGPAPIEVHLEHARGFVDLSGGPIEADQLVMDMGSGGGIPGLAFAIWVPQAKIYLLDGSVRRCEFLNWALHALDVGERVKVVAERAEIAGRDSHLRGRFHLVLSRGFGPPGVTAECAAPFLGSDGALVVSEPPGDQIDDVSKRWPAEGCAELNLALEEYRSLPHAFVRLRALGACSDRFPRRVGIPSKRPLF